MTRLSKYTKELLEPIVRASYSMADVFRHLGLKYTGGNHIYVGSKIKNLGISTAHFTGQLWSKGKTAEEDSRILRGGYTDAEVFIKNSPLSGSSGSKIRERLLRLGWEYECSICGISEWQGQRLTLHIDHVDGDRTNNELMNLRFLCPNCHQQTETWGNKNSRRSYSPEYVKVLRTRTPKVKTPKQPKEHKRCVICGSVCNRRNYKYCSQECAHKAQQKAERPSKEELEKLVWEMSTVKIADMFTVSDTAVAKWCKSYGISKPERGYWAKQKELK